MANCYLRKQFVVQTSGSHISRAKDATHKNRNKPLHPSIHTRPNLDRDAPTQVNPHIGYDRGKPHHSPNILVELPPTSCTLLSEIHKQFYLQAPLELQKEI